MNVNLPAHDSHSDQQSSSAVHYLYIVSEGFPPTVFDSQVLEHIRLMEGQGIYFDLLVFERLFAVRKHWKRNLQRARELRTRLKGLIHLRILVTTFLGWDLWVPRCQLGRILRSHERSSRRVIHARTQTSAAIAVPFKRHFPNLKVVFDMRGDSAAEYLLSIQKPGGQTHSVLVRKKAAKLRAIEELAARGSDHVICVSEAMKRKVIDNYGIESSKIQVVPTVASAEKFHRDPLLREQARLELGIHEQFLLVYAGSLVAYQLLDSLVNLLKTLMESRRNVCFLVVSPEGDKARTLVSSRLPAERFFVKSARHHEMLRWLNAADAGCLIRESNAVNNVAAPTKFPEYLMCGLPVLISEGIGDYSDLVLREQVGIVLKELDSPEELLRKWPQLEALTDEASRQRISRLASDHFSNQKFAEVFEKLYSL